MSTAPEQFDRVLAFYKGSMFPMVLGGAPGDWAEFGTMANRTIVQALREGDSIPQQIAIHLQLLNKMDDCMYATEAAKPQWTAQDKMDDLCRVMGSNGIIVQSQWYLAIYCLLRFGTLEDNDQHGFVFASNHRFDAHGRR